MFRLNTALGFGLASFAASALGCTAGVPPGPTTGAISINEAPYMTASGMQLFEASAGTFNLPTPGNRATRAAILSTSDALIQLTVSIGSAPANTTTPPLGATTRRRTAPSQFERVSERYARPDNPRYGLHQASAVVLNSEQPFWVIRPTRRSGTSDVQVTTRTAYVGEHCEVFVDRRLGNTLDEQVAAIATTFDQQIYPKEAEIFGAPITPAGMPGKVGLIISSDVNNNGRDGTIGYFTARDLLPVDADAAPELAHSNGRMLLYMAANVVKSSKPAEYLGTVAHEYQHLSNATHKLFGPEGAKTTEDVWLDEGLSMYAMQATGYGLNSDATTLLEHVRGYLDNSELYSLTDWRYNPSQAGYGGAFLFLVYLVDREGEAIVKELSNAPEVGIANVEARLASRGTHFQTLFRDWATANMVTGDATVSDARFRYRSITLPANSRGGNAVLSAQAAVPGGGQMLVLPWSASYLTLNGASGGLPFAMTASRTVGISALIAVGE